MWISSLVYTLRNMYASADKAVHPLILADSIVIARRLLFEWLRRLCDPGQANLSGRSGAGGCAMVWVRPNLAEFVMNTVQFAPTLFFWGAKFRRSLRGAAIHPVSLQKVGH